jgi:hypothetical protein
MANQRYPGLLRGICLRGTEQFQSAAGQQLRPAGHAQSVSLKTFSYSRSKSFFTGKTAAQPVQFTTNAFSNTGPWELGSSKRAYAALRTPPLRIENFDVIKSFNIGEHVKATLRLDYFNAFNRTQLQAPDNNSLDSIFGQITNLSSQISNRQGQGTFRLEF